MQIIGHQKIINFLNKSAARDSTSAAYLFCGVEHLGKFKVALDFAEKITKGTDQKINPDIIVIRPEREPASTRGGDRSSTRGGEKKGIVKKKDIKVEQIRELQRGLAMTPYFGHCKVAIIDDADRLTVSAQNALLKTLEEPDDRSILILICHDQEKILPTVKSRCITRSFNPVSGKEIENLFPSGGLSRSAVFWSLGRPGLAVEFSHDSSKLSALEKSQERLAEFLRSNLTDKFSLAEELSKDVPRLQEELQTWTIIFRQNMQSPTDFLNMSGEKSLEMIEKIAANLALMRRTNSNVRVVLENLFLAF
ncbi:MAG: hypothetical protein WC022_03425 [Parcubacteria group bacterium]